MYYFAIDNYKFRLSGMSKDECISNIIKSCNENELDVQQVNSRPCCIGLLHTLFEVHTGNDFSINEIFRGNVYSNPRKQIRFNFLLQNIDDHKLSIIGEGCEINLSNLILLNNTIYNRYRCHNIYDSEDGSIGVCYNLTEQSFEHSTTEVHNIHIRINKWRLVRNA